MKRWLPHVLLSLGFIGIIALTLYIYREQSPTKTEQVATQHPHIPTLSVPPETFHNKNNVNEYEHQLHSLRAGLTITTNTQSLSVLTDDEKIVEDLSPKPEMRPEQIGFARQLTGIIDNQLVGNTLDWNNVPGGKVAYWVLQSPDAIAMRIQLIGEQIPADAEFRFFSPNDLNKTYGLYAAEDVQSTATKPHFWSPTVFGDQMGMEIFLPERTSTDTLSLSVPIASHLFKHITEESNTPELRAAQHCHIDLSCVDNEWQVLGKSVAKYIYTDNGIPYLCTGTLIQDTDDSSQIPYFLTASHCIDNINSAQSMELYWLFQSTSCNGAAATPEITRQGGALLTHSTTTDSSLILLNELPPDGTTMSGWTLDALSPGDTIHGIHHPDGDVKKYSLGTFQNFTQINLTNNLYQVVDDPDGNFIKVKWSQGITAGGSSGSGLWVNKQGVPYLVGALVGGSSYCNAPDSPDDYGRFDRSFPDMSQWLNPLMGSPNLDFTTSGEQPTGLKDGVLLGRYLQGLRGNELTAGIAESEDITQLEMKLAQSAPLLDIDGNGIATVDEDALLIVRFLLGLRGDALIQEALSNNATRTDPIEVELYLSDLYFQ
jgi:hypothetical protein